MLQVNRLARKIIPLTAILIIVLICTTPAHSQATDETALSYQAFNQLAAVYRSGGSAPSLLSRLNSALALIADANVKRAQGDTPDSLALKGQARTIIQQLLPTIPAAEQQAAQATRLRTQWMIVEGAVVVFLLTIAFYTCLRIWRWYEKEKLYEMRIVAGKTEA